MNSSYSLRGRISIRPLVLALVLAGSGFGNPLHAADTNRATGANADADQAWKEVEKALQPPLPPAEWQSVQPGQEQVDKFLALQAGMAGLAADRARDFYTKYPNHPKAALARQKQFEMLQIALRLGNTNRTAELDTLTQGRLKDPNLTEDERFDLRIAAINRELKARSAVEGADLNAAMEEAGRTLIREFPRRRQGYDALLSVAQRSDTARARSLAEFIAAGDGPDEAKSAANGLLKRLEAVGKPLELKFTALDGREVDVRKLSGKVVLVDFWATWCMPCVAGLPRVKQAYDHLHARGFEIVGISLDAEKETLETFIRNRKLEWPQYFDGQGWGNKFAREFSVNGIPTLWLVDKKGNLHDPNAGEDLEAKVEKLLAE